MIKKFVSKRSFLVGGILLGISSLWGASLEEAPLPTSLSAPVKQKNPDKEACKSLVQATKEILAENRKHYDHVRNLIPSYIYQETAWGSGLTSKEKSGFIISWILRVKEETLDLSLLKPSLEVAKDMSVVEEHSIQSSSTTGERKAEEKTDYAQKRKALEEEKQDILDHHFAYAIRMAEIIPDASYGGRNRQTLDLSTTNRLIEVWVKKFVASRIAETRKQRAEEESAQRELVEKKSQQTAASASSCETASKETRFSPAGSQSGPSEKTPLHGTQQTVEEPSGCCIIL